MHMTTLKILEEPWSDEMHTWVHNCAKELHQIFSALGWTWSGDPVHQYQLSDKIVGLCLDVTRTLARGENWTAVNGGRIKVEGRRPSIDRNDISLWVYLCAYIPGDDPNTIPGDDPSN